MVRCTRLAKSLGNLRLTLHLPNKIFSCLVVDGTFACFKALAFSLCMCGCTGRMLFPRFSTSSEDHVPLSRFSVPPGSRKLA